LAGTSFPPVSNENGHAVLEVLSTEELQALPNNL